MGGAWTFPFFFFRVGAAVKEGETVASRCTCLFWRMDQYEEDWVKWNGYLI
jgi:hypothetical protein